MLTTYISSDIQGRVPVTLPTLIDIEKHLLACKTKGSGSIEASACWRQERTWKCGLATHLEICLNSGSWIFLNCVGSMTSRISSISPRNITYFDKRCTT